MKGPTAGVVMLPMHLSLPGLRECDVSDETTRRGMYGMLLSQGQRNDIVRFVNAALLAADWPLIADSLDPRLRRWCERQFALGGDQAASDEAADDQAADDQAATISEGGAIA